MSRLNKTAVSFYHITIALQLSYDSKTSLLQQWHHIWFLKYEYIIFCHFFFLKIVYYHIITPVNA